MSNPSDERVEKIRKYISGTSSPLYLVSVHQVIDLLAALDARDAKLAGVRAAIEGFDGAVDDLRRHLESRGNGGQHVPFTGDFAGVPPSVCGQLRRWSKIFHKAIDE